MAAKPSPRYDALRAMREAQFAKAKPVKAPKDKIRSASPKLAAAFDEQMARDEARAFRIGKH